MTEDREVAGIRCMQVLAKLSSYLDDELSPPEVELLSAHVSGCDTCERFGGRFSRAVMALRASAAAPTPEQDAARAARLKARLGLP